MLKFVYYLLVGWLCLAGGTPARAAPIPPLSGLLRFADIETRFTQISNDPSIGAVAVPEGFQTALAVTGQSGSLSSHPEWTFGDGTTLRVLIKPNGDAIYSGDGVIDLTGSQNGQSKAGNVAFRFAKLRLSSAGLSAFDAVADFPAGAGWSLTETNAVLRGYLPLGIVPVDGEIQPIARTFTLKSADFGAASLWFHHEELPLLLPVPAIEWEVDTSTFQIGTGEWRFIREKALTFLEEPTRAVSLVDPSAAHRLSNDHFFRRARHTESHPVTLHVGDQGEGELNARVRLGDPVFQPHFPAGLELPVADGLYDVRSSVVDLNESYLATAPDTPLSIPYARSCPFSSCSEDASPGTIWFSAQNQRFLFTPDGGLVARTGVGLGSDLMPPVHLEWGALGGDRFAQFASEFVEAFILLPGFRLREDASSQHIQAADRPASLLYSGYGQPTDERWLERPSTEEYQLGKANYAGLNFRVQTAGEQAGVSWVAGKRLPAIGSYPLNSNTKYYIRAAGVSGVHQAVSSGIPPALQLYGFNLALDGLRLSYLDNMVERSATDGAIEVPYPSRFTQPFAELRLRCNGQLMDAKPAGDSDHSLDYWLTDFSVWTLEFRQPPTAACDSTNGVLLLGSEVALPGIARSARGILGFHPDGQLVSPTDGVPGIDSRLTLPSSLALKGPNNSAYALHGVTKAYFNRWPGPGKTPESGFLNFAGKMGLPYFQEAKVHIHAVPGGKNPQLFIMGGWTSNDRPQDLSRAWLDGAGHSFFEAQDFDAAGIGYPQSITLDQYRGVVPLADPRAYRPAAQQSWLDVIDFDLPLRWEPATRTFGPAASQRENLLVFALEAQADRLIPTDAHLSFGTRFDIPRFSLQEFLLSELEGRTSLFSSVSNAVSRTIQNSAAAQALRDGASAFDRALTPELDRLFNKPLSLAFDPIGEKLVDAMEGIFNTGATVQSAVCSEASNANNALRQAIANIQWTEGFTTNLAGSVLTALRQADDAVTSAIDIVAAKTINDRIATQHRYVVTEILKRVIQDSSDDQHPVVKTLATYLATQNASLVDDLLSKYVGTELEPSLADIERVLRDVHRTLQDLIPQPEQLQGQLGSEFISLSENTSALKQFATAAEKVICDDFKSIVDPAHDFFSQRDRIKSRVKTLLKEQMLQATLPKELHFLLKEHLSEPRGLFRGALENLFQKLNDAIIGVMRGPLLDVIGELDSGAQSALDQLSGMLKGSRLHGHAWVNGHALESLRVDGHFRFNLGDGANTPLVLDGFYEAESFDSDSPGRGCREPGRRRTEVRFGASTTPSTGFFAGLPLGAEGRFSLGEGGKLLGAAGGLSVTGNKRVGTFTLSSPTLGFSFGTEGNFLGGQVKGNFTTPNGDLFVSERVFFGRGCRLSDLELIDPDTARLLEANGVLGGDEVIGFYLSFDGAMPLEQLISGKIPQQCLLDLEGRGGTGYFGFLFPGVGARLKGFNVGYRQRWGVHGELLCLANFTGDLNLIGAVGINPATQRPQGTIVGQLQLGARVGWPVQKEIRKNLPWTAVVDGDRLEIQKPF